MDYINRALFICLCLFGVYSYAQQITVDNTLSPQNLIENYLIQGCVEVSNVSSPQNGNVVGLGSFGYFERGASNFPFENGIILTTGDANSAGNTENTATLNDGNSSWGTDPDLEAALGITQTLNATSLEFNFISISNQIQFNYILASEEYFGNFPCEYSDGFAFLIREVSSSAPYTNIALIPGTTIPVNTNTIHDEIVGFCDASNEQYFEGYSLGDTNYNGRTTVLSATATIQPNVEYQIKLVIADQTDQNYDSAVFIQGNSFDASVDLGEDFSTCADDVILNGDIGNPQATYSWYFNDVLVPDEIQNTLNVTQTGNYRVRIEIPLSGSTCVIEDDINLTLSSTQSSGPISDFEVCDDSSNDSIETFDLTLKNSEVLASVPPSDYVISYHFSEIEAQNGLNAINSTIQNITSPQTIYVRIEDTNNGCLAFSSFNLVVNPLPNINNPSPLEVCDDQVADGFTTIDLNIKNDEITNGLTNLIVTYHSTPADAAIGVNPLPMPYVNTNSNEQVFVSVRNEFTGCISTTSLDITVLENPVINTEDHYIDACDADHDGFAIFDLTSIIPEVLQGLTGVTVTFHETNDDALTGSNPIADATNYTNIVSEEQILYIRVENDTTGCASITPVEIHTNLLLTATDISDVSLCDIDNDGVEEFNFLSIAAGIINDLPEEFAISVEFYLTETDRDNQQNAIDQTVPFIPNSNPQTIYLGLTSVTCYDIEQIDLILVPVYEFENIVSQTVCDEDQDGVTTTDLSQFDALVTDNLEGFNVSYFLTEEDARNNTNVLPNFYTNSTNPFTVYPRITSDESGCSDITFFEITVLEAPLTSTPSNIIICDNDQDGLFTINLLDSISQVVSNTNDRQITFHTSQTDADNGTNTITNVSNYSAQTETVYIRVENTNTGCYSVESLQITVNTLPVFTTIDNYRICEDSSDGFADFIFSTKDAEILNGQTGKDVSYYLSQEDADTRTNAIDKDVPYQNISTPQTIFVRVENITDQDCYGTSSFIIEVGTNPVFNEPTDWFVCDDLSNDGNETFDLSTKITEISQGIADDLNITFYTSYNDAENGINTIPLDYTNTVNPQTIFVQIDNGTICNSITSFELNVIQVPDVNPSVPLTECDTDYDGYTVFDLTNAEFDILDVRQDDIEISYFENYNDAEADSNSISNPEAYTNISNPQTVYIKINNTISNCYVLVPIELNVNMPPVINEFQSYDICENEDNSFDLTEINEVIMDESFNVLFTYYTNEADAYANENALNTHYTYLTNNDTLFARAEFSTTHCFMVYEFTLNVNPLPIANQPNDLESCDDDFDGLLEFDLTQQNTQILGTQNPFNYTITYHNSEEDAQLNLLPLDTNYFAFDSEIIFARVENNITGCYTITQFSVIIHPLPVIDIEDQVICLENLPLIVSANTNNPTDTYLWSTGETSENIEITEIGTYWVSVTNEYGCENSRVFSVSESEAATIEATEVIDFSDPNNITVTITGIGNYLYQLDDGEPQQSNVFENVPMGYHTITIIDLNGCSEVTRDVLVIDIPKHMTPNNDGQFDRWHIIGVETLPGTIIHIFDRYGKHLTTLTHDGPGWDGTFNGYKLPASDYWFVANVVRGSESFQVKGHFAIRR
ncbi:choice-of-anchor L domain-containing protein [Winogradskyella aquimaris]|uniref:Choice-of-anchor L domain-containing protein n=1 Tax=Winogradskyella aquimaris TaxID=864074 RepID=A0ABU5ERQ8_9FLAO|nr:choice-of-anchor L domain-containing protein [Winogradskyella aquimaris]MDY2588420.1 choice-of-anchor L domain-containing protein [Winogradskyella aquimaris]